MSPKSKPASNNRPCLPASLKEEICEQRDEKDKRKFEHKFRNREKTRKIKRKLARLEKKHKRAKVQAQEIQKPLAKRQKTDDDSISSKKEKNSGKQKVTRTQQVENFSARNPRKNDESIEDDEERAMRRLEKKLKIKSSAKLSKVFKDDGLDELLEGITVGSQKSRLNLSKNKDNSQEKNDKKDIGNQKFKESTSEDDESDRDSETFLDLEEFNIESEETDNENLDADDSNDEKCEEDSEDEEGDDEEEEEKEKSIKYKPPQLREKPVTTNAQESDKAKQEQISRLQRQLQGFLNRLSESNIESIIMNIEEIYENNIRHDVTSTITTFILNLISTRSMILDQFVILYAALVTALYKIVGIDFCAYFTQTLIEDFERFHDQYLQTADLEEKGGKECINLIVLVSELYNFQVVSCVLIYDLIRLFIADFTELNVELLLKIVKHSGYQLRQDDPSVLKEIVQQIHNETSKRDPQSLAPRTKFMIETIINLKNNRLKQQSIVTNTESTLRMKKFLGNLGKKIHVQATQPLRASLEDIRSIEAKGKWWLVGSAWNDNMIGDKSSTLKQPEKRENVSDALLNLAKQQKMNTDVRRSIFVILMSGEDYVDAFERLLKLGLKEVQAREIPRVLIHCCGNEKIHNPYYALIAQRLCNYDHSFKITFQYCLWDFLRECGENDVGGMELIKNTPTQNDEVKEIPLRRLVNLAKLYAILISERELSTIILKTVSFTKLHSQSQLFFQLFFSNIIILTLTKNTRKPNPQKLSDVFGKSALNPTLEQGILFFLHHFVKKGEILKNEEQKEIIRWGCSIIKQTIRDKMSVDEMLD
ncbi:hypothetical protein Glove_46g58 [Diversispora epigaea]|uniref:MI domain-containing protein n=1 Tax=Diversispora epigaea TaxID=1348612 RepID=A0A397JHQ1_9GLOM|nr:hypothetical protein Glove_46g58 [Diversispora epigaea]